MLGRRFVGIILRVHVREFPRHVSGSSNLKTFDLRRVLLVFPFTDARIGEWLWGFLPNDRALVEAGPENAVVGIRSLRSRDHGADRGFFRLQIHFWTLPRERHAAQANCGTRADRT